MESLTLAVRVVTTGSVDTAELADVAARTFPLACPPATAPENIASFIDTNLSAAFYLCRAAWPVFRRQNCGVVVNLSSLSARVLPDASQNSRMRATRNTS